MDENLKETLFDLFAYGILQGQMMMLATIEDLGIVNGKMAEFLRTIVEGDTKVNQHFPSKKSIDLTVNNAAEKIRRMQETES